MIVTFHGVRGSTPCQSEAVARYGGNTSCVSVTAAGEQPLLFDLGTGLRHFGDSLTPGKLFRGTALLSHLHWDHVQGLPFFRPLLCRGAEMVIHAPSLDDGRHPREALRSTIGPPFFPVTLDDFGGTVDVRRAEAQFSVGSFDVRSADVPHTGATCGYRVEHEGRSVAYVCDHQQPSDTAHVATSVVDLCRDVDLLIHDAQYTADEFEQKSTWGHCTAEYAVTVAARAGARSLALFHHDPFHDDATLDRVAAAARQLGGACGIDVFAAAEGDSVEVGSATPRAAAPAAR